MWLKAGLETDKERDSLLGLALNGDRETLDRLFASYMRPLYQVGLRVLRSPEDAEDALQDGARRRAPFDRVPSALPVFHLVDPHRH